MTLKILVVIAFLSMSSYSNAASYTCSSPLKNNFNFQLTLETREEFPCVGYSGFPQIEAMCIQRSKKSETMTYLKSVVGPDTLTTLVQKIPGQNIYMGMYQPKDLPEGNYNLVNFDLDKMKFMLATFYVGSSDGIKSGAILPRYYDCISTSK